MMDDRPFVVERVEPGRFRLSGELDIGTVPLLGQAVADDGPVRGDLVLDLRDLTFIDSTGVRGLISLADGLDPEGVVVLAAPGPTIARVFDLMGLARHPRLRVEAAS